MSTATLERPTLRVRASDVTGQRQTWLDPIENGATVGELLSEAREKLGLPPHDAEGNPLRYRALHVREGRPLHASEVAAEILETGDELTLHPNIDAGGR